VKSLIFNLILAQVLGSTYSYPFPYNEVVLSSYSTFAIKQASEEELTKRFDELLDKELSEKKVCVAPSAARELGNLMRQAAQTIIQEKAFHRLSEAEKNVKEFASELIINGDTDSGQIKITSRAIRRTFGQTSEPGAGLCPLYPICK
jgi:hypothetical protein